jgi:hypothetical protein
MYFHISDGTASNIYLSPVEVRESYDSMQTKRKTYGVLRYIVEYSAELSDG